MLKSTFLKYLESKNKSSVFNLSDKLKPVLNDSQSSYQLSIVNEHLCI